MLLQLLTVSNSSFNIIVPTRLIYYNILDIVLKTQLSVTCRTAQLHPYSAPLGTVFSLASVLHSPKYTHVHYNGITRQKISKYKISANLVVKIFYETRIIFLSCLLSKNEHHHLASTSNEFDR